MRIKNILNGFVVSVLMVFGAVTALTAPVAAAGDYCSGSGKFLTFKPWYDGLTESNDSTKSCNIKNPDDVTKFIWKIVLNIIYDMLMAVGYLCVAYVIFGGFKYMSSSGSSDGMAKAKSTIMNALIGLVISMMSVAIVNTVAGSF